MTETGLYIDREQAKQRAETESKRADMKQHADKLIQGFEKLEESHAKRAIWELFQNAIDLSDNCDIIIEYNCNELRFSHNGKPFNSKTLSCLIKQVSSKVGENNSDEVGQYGTGFICTHSFGKRILVSGSIKESDYYIPIDNFDIDRIAGNSDILIDKLIDQQNQVFDLVERGKLVEEARHYTSFAYQISSDLERQNAKKAIESLPVILPYVMMINDKVHIVRVVDENKTETVYRRGEVSDSEEIRITNIHINHDVKRIYSLHSKNEDLTIILPFNKDNHAILFDKGLSRLFLFYPLIGSEKFGFNFIIHSKLFAPTEPRDGIHLKSNNEQVQDKESKNRNLIDAASSMIFDFVERRANMIENPRFFALIDFVTSQHNPLLSDYFIELKERWINKFKTYPLVETNGNRISVSETCFFSEELLNNEEYLDAIYSVVSLFWPNIPQKSIVKDWTRTISTWADSSISFIRISDIAKKIENAASLNCFPCPEDLIRFYEYIILTSHGELFTQYKLLPNIKNEFRLSVQLNKTLNIDEILIRIADVIIPDVPKKYIKSGFELGLSFELYDRRQFSKDINSAIAELNKSISKDNLLPQELRISIIEFCKIFPSLDNTGTRGELLRIVCEYYKIDCDFVTLSSAVNQEIDWIYPTRCLLKNFIWELNTQSNDWIKENYSFIGRLLNTIYDYADFDDLVQTLPIFPNQLFEFCKQGDLRVDDEIPDDLKNLYDEILKPEQQIRRSLILKEFPKYMKRNDNRTPKSLGDSIDKTFQDAMPYSEINTHPYKDHILLVIKKISDDAKWATYFPIIEEKKATIMMAKISDSDVKNDLFSIIGLGKEKIALLGDLSRQYNLERIIELGKQALEEEMRNNADFQFKHTIGTHIEALIREKINSELQSFSVTTKEEQGGQDIVIEFNGEIIYYIEVKSRWDINSSITMSPLQMKNAVKNMNNYSLCCVDMYDYKQGDYERYNVRDVFEIVNRIYVLNDIGARVEPLLSGIISVKDYDDEISLFGDYRGLVPQKIVKSGQTFDQFINYLLDFFQKLLLK